MKHPLSRALTRRSTLDNLRSHSSPRSNNSGGSFREDTSSESDTGTGCSEQEGGGSWRTFQVDEAAEGLNEGRRGTHRHSKLHWSESVYDETFIVLLRHGHVRDGRWTYARGALRHAVCLLLLNLFLQGVVLWKVQSLSSSERATLQDDLVEVCEDLPQRQANFTRRLEAQPAAGVSFIDCQPLALTLMLGLPSLDRDGDGWWTAEEALQTQAEMEPAFSREANLRLVFHRFLRLARRGGLFMQGPGGNGSALALATRNWTAIPMEMLRREEPVIELCSLNDPHMCSNIEARGILVSRVPEGIDSNREIVDDRIEWCESMQSTYCPQLFGERYRHYADRTVQLCGTRHADWDKGQRVRNVLYDRSYKYVSSSDGVVHIPYMAFLLVILMIWFAAMLEEGREVCLWWLVLLQLPVREASPPRCHPEEEFKIEFIPSLHKRVMILLNLLPRTLICFALLVVGAQFLIRADDYSNLILNSVALGFLIEVDNMLFAAVTSDTCKLLVRSCKPCKVRGLPCQWDTQTLLFTTALTGLAVLFEGWSYLRPSGKLDVGERLVCLCQVSGVRCVAAQILGGLPHLPRLDTLAWLMH